MADTTQQSPVHTNSPSHNTLDVNNFFKYYILSPISGTLSAQDQAIATVASLVLGVVTLGVVHLACRLFFYDRSVALITPSHPLAPVAVKVNDLMKVTLLQDNPADLSSKDSEPALLSSHRPILKDISPRLFAHIHSDSYAKDSGLEGNTFVNSFEAAIAYIKDERVKIPKKEELLKNYEKMLYWSKLLTKSSHEDTYLKEVMKGIKKLNVGESLELPGGWVEEMGGHAMIYSIACTAEGKYQFSVLNTGSGCEYHYNELKGGTSKGLCRLRMEQKEIDMLSLEEGLRVLMELQRSDSAKIPVGDRKALIYEKVLPMMGLTPMPLDPNEDVADPRTLQRSGTCSWKVQMAYLDEWIKKHSDCPEEAKQAYKLVKRQIRFFSLLDYYQQHKKDLHNHRVAVQLEKTLRRMARSLEKARKLGEVSKEEMSQMIEACDVIRKSLDASYKRTSASVTFNACENPLKRKARWGSIKTFVGKLRGKDRLETKAVKPMDPAAFDCSDVTKAAQELHLSLKNLEDYVKSTFYEMQIEDTQFNPFEKTYFEYSLELLGVYPNKKGRFQDTIRSNRKNDLEEAQNCIAKNIHNRKMTDRYLESLKEYAEKGTDCPDELLSALSTLVMHDLPHHQLALMLYCVNKLTEKKREALGLPPLGTGGRAKHALSDFLGFDKLATVSMADVEKQNRYLRYLVENDHPGILSQRNALNPSEMFFSSLPFSPEGIAWMEKSAGLSEGSLRDPYEIIRLIKYSSSAKGKLPDWAKLAMNLSLKCSSSYSKDSSLRSFVKEHANGTTTLIFPNNILPWASPEQIEAYKRTYDFSSPFNPTDIQEDYIYVDNREDTRKLRNDFDALRVNFDDLGKNLLQFSNKYLRNFVDKCSTKGGGFFNRKKYMIKKKDYLIDAFHQQYPNGQESKTAETTLTSTGSEVKSESVEVYLSKIQEYLFIPGVLQRLFEKEPHYIGLYADFFHEAIKYYQNKGDIAVVCELAQLSHKVITHIPERDRAEASKFPNSHALLLEAYSTSTDENLLLYYYLSLPLPKVPSLSQVAEYIAVRGIVHKPYDENDFNIHNFIVTCKPEELKTLLQRAVEASTKLGVTFPDIPWEEASCHAYANGQRIEWMENGKKQQLDYLFSSVVLNGQVICGGDKRCCDMKKFDAYKWKGCKTRDTYTTDYTYRDYEDAQGNISKLRSPKSNDSPVQILVNDAWYNIDPDNSFCTDKKFLSGLLLEEDVVCVNTEANGSSSLLICGGRPLKERVRIYLTPNKRAIESMEWLEHPGKGVVAPNKAFIDPYWGIPRMALEPADATGRTLGVISYPKVGLTFEIHDEGEGKNSIRCKEFPGFTLAKKSVRYHNNPQTICMLQNSQGEQILIEPGEGSRAEVRLSADGHVQPSSLKENLHALDYFLRLEASPDVEEKAREMLNHCLPARPMTTEEEELMRSVILGNEVKGRIVTAEAVAIRLKLIVRWIDHFDTYPSAVNPFESNRGLQIVFNEKGSWEYKDNVELMKWNANKSDLLERYISSTGVYPPLQLTASELSRLGVDEEKIKNFFNNANDHYPTTYKSAKISTADLNDFQQAAQLLQMPPSIINKIVHLIWKSTNTRSLRRWLNGPTLEARHNVYKTWKPLFNALQGNDEKLKKQILFRLKTSPDLISKNDPLRNKANNWCWSVLLLMAEGIITIPKDVGCYDFEAIQSIIISTFKPDSSIVEEQTIKNQEILMAYTPRHQDHATSQSASNDYNAEEILTENTPSIGMEATLPQALSTIPAPLAHLVSPDDVVRTPQTFKFDSSTIQDPTTKHHLQRIDQDLEAYRNSAPAKVWKVNDKEKLSQELNILINEDLDKLKREKKALLDLAGKYPEQEEEIAWRKIAERSGSFVLPTIERLVGLYLQADEEAFRKMNPALTSDEINRLVHVISSYIDLKTSIDRRERVINKLNDPNETEDAISEAITEARHYSDKQYPANRQRAFQVFEFFSGKSLRGKQVEMLNEILDGKVDGKHREFIKQLIMGGGKSEVILPLLAALLADGHNLALLCVPRSLLESQREEMRRFCMNLFGRNVMPFEFDRKADTTYRGLTKLYQRLVRAINNREFVMSTPEAIEALQHLEIEMLLQGKPEASQVQRILSLLKTRGVAVLDEAHAILNARRELNYTIGERKTLQSDHLSWVRRLYGFLATDPTLKGLIDVTAQSSPSDTKINAAAIQNRLAACIIEESHFTLSQEDQELLRQYLTRDNTLKIDPPFLATLPIEEQSRLALYREEIGRLLATTLGKVALQEYAYGPDVFAIPAHHSQVQIGTEFGFPLEAANYTYQLLLSAPLPLHYMKKVAMTIVSNIKEQFEMEGDQGTNAKEELKLFKRLFPNSSIDDDLDQHLGHAVEVIRRDPLLALEIAQNYILPHLTYYPKKISSNSFRFVEMIGKVFGFTGTPANDDSYPDRLGVGEAVLDPGTDGLTCDLLIGMNPTVSIIQEPTIDPKATYQESAKLLVDSLNIAQGSSVRAVIDTAAYFKGIPNRLVAEEIKSAVGAQIQGINYYDVDKKVISPEKDPNKRVTFYDDAHTIGAHFDQATDAEAVVIIGENIQLSHLLQAVWRMRQIHRNQKISFAMTDAVRKLIESKQGCQQVGIEEILRFAAANQAEHVALDTYRATALKFPAAVRSTVLAVMRQFPDRSNGIFAAFAKLDAVFTEKSLFDPLVLFGKVNSLDNTVKILNDLRNSWIERVKALKWSCFAECFLTENNVQEVKEKVVNAKEKAVNALEAVVIPPANKMPQQSELPITAVGSEVFNQVQMQSNVEAEKETQLELMVQQLAENNNQYNQRNLVEKWKWSENSLANLDSYVTRQRDKTANFSQDIPEPAKDQDEPPLKPAQAFSPLFNLIGDKTELYLSANFYARYGKDSLDDTTVGCLDQRSVRHILVLDGKGQPDGKNRLIIVNEDDMKDLSKWLLEHKQDSRWVYHMWTDNADLTSSLDAANKKMESEEMQRALILAKLLDGRVNFGRKEQLLLEPMIQQMGSKQFSKFVAKFVGTNPALRAKLKGSVLNRLVRRVQEKEVQGA